MTALDPEAAAVVHQRYFAGLGVDEAVSAPDASAPTVQRHRAFARG